MQTHPESQKREKYVRINGKKCRFRNDAQTWLARFAAARGYTEERAVEYLIIVVKDFIPIREYIPFPSGVTIQDVDNGVQARL